MNFDELQSKVSEMSLFECDLLMEAVSDRIKDIKALARNKIGNKKTYTIEEFKERFINGVFYDIEPNAFYYAYDDEYTDLNVADNVVSFDEDCKNYKFTKIVYAVMEITFDEKVY